MILHYIINIYITFILRFFAILEDVTHALNKTLICVI